MPYDNFYNRDLARNLDAKNKAWAYVHAYSSVSPSLRGGAHVKIGNASKHDGVDGSYNNDIEFGPSYYLGEGYKSRDVGGSGFASGSFRDTGYESVEGAGSMEYKKAVMPEGDGYSGGVRLGLPDSLAGDGISGGFKFSDLGNSDWWKGLRIEGGDAMKKMDLEAREQMMKPSPLNPRDASRDKDAVFKTGEGLVPKAQMPGSSLSGMGHKCKVCGCKTCKCCPKCKAKKCVCGAGKGCGKSGGGDGRAKRAEIVKAYMKKHGVKMIEASKKVKELGLYKK